MFLVSVVCLMFNVLKLLLCFCLIGLRIVAMCSVLSNSGVRAGVCALKDKMEDAMVTLSHGAR